MTSENEETKIKIMNALEDKNYKFRTINGISKATRTDRETVEKIIRSEGKRVVISYRKTKDGEDLYTTRTHYEESASLKEKIMGAFLNRVY